MEHEHCRVVVFPCAQRPYPRVGPAAGEQTPQAPHLARKPAHCWERRPKQGQVQQPRQDACRLKER